MISLAMATLSCASNWYGAHRTPEGWLFLWSPAPWDGNHYFGKMRAGYRGEWRHTNLNTSEEHPPVVLHPFPILAGHAARLLGAAVRAATGVTLPGRAVLVATWELLHFLLAALLSLMLWRLAGLFTRRLGYRTWIVMTIWLANGFGKPGIIDASILASCLHFPHFIMALVAYAWLCGTFIRSMRPRARVVPCVAAAAAAATIVGWVHPFDVPPLAAIGAAALALRWLEQRRLPAVFAATYAAFGVAAMAAVLPQVSLRRSVPQFERQYQANVATLRWPSPWSPEIMLDLYLVAAAAALPFLWSRRRRPEVMFLMAWLGAGLVVLHLPVPFTSRFVEGYPIALGLAVGLWSEHVLGWRRRVRWRRHAGHAIVLALLLPRTVGILHDTTVGLYGRLDPGRHFPPHDAAATEWLERHTRWSDVVWAPPLHGNALPFLSGNRTFFGHNIETLSWISKKDWSLDLFTRRLPPAHLAVILREYGVDYVYATPEITLPGYRGLEGYAPRILGRPVYDDGYAQIYRITP